MLKMMRFLTVVGCMVTLSFSNLRVVADYSHQQAIRIFALAWSPSGEILAVGRNDGLWLYDQAGAELNNLPLDGINAITWSPDSTRLAVHEISTRSQTLILHVPSLEIENDAVITRGGENQFPLSWNPANSDILATTFGEDIILWEATNWTQIDSISTKHNDFLTTVEWSHDGRWIASGGYDGNVYVWDVESHDLVAAFDDFGIFVNDVSWDFDNESLAIAGVRSEILIWNILSNKITEELPFDGVTALDVELNDKIVAFSTTEEEVIVWERQEGHMLRSYQLEYSTFSIDITPDGNRVTYPGKGASFIISPTFLPED